MVMAAGLFKMSLCLELGLLFGLLPLLCRVENLPVIAVLLAAAVLTFLWLLKNPGFDRDCFIHMPLDRKVWLQALAAWIVLTPCLAGLAWWARPESFFGLPLHRPLLWILILFAYPLISVAPQEIIYRAFFCHRYAPLFGRGTGMELASAAAFGFAHIVFGNWIAVALTLAGGWLFARAYLQTRSLPFVAVQHALYGGTIFTVGLGHYFFYGPRFFLQSLGQHGH
jgi:membrane protease YdiL (CAAX protease family)